MEVSKSVVAHPIAVWVARVKHWPVTSEKIWTETRNEFIMDEI